MTEQLDDEYAEYLPRHWHTGIGPADGVDPESQSTFAWDDLAGVADSLADLCSEATEGLSQLIVALNPERGAADELEQLREFKRGVDTMDALDTERQNLMRADVPLYKDDPALWADTVRKMIAADFPFVFEWGGRNDDEPRTAIYAYECDYPETCVNDMRYTEFFE